jgi:hypothetical protein
MIRHSKKYLEEFNDLLRSGSMEVYLEPERKLDVPSEADLSKIESHIRRSHYYVPLNGKRSNHDIPPGIQVSTDDINNLNIRPAGEDTVRRFRLYYDTPDLDGYKGHVEVRIEFPKPTSHGSVLAYKQVIKMGLPATSDDPTFHRIEISGKLRHPIPSFEPAALDGNKKLSAFLKDHFDVDAFRPLQLLTTARTRYYCRPDGCENTVVEFGYDRGRAMTLNNFRYPILQIEPEVLHGDEAVLGDISKRLTQRFKVAAVNLESKPTPGWRHLDEILTGNKAAKSFLLGLPQDKFRFISPDECPALFARNERAPRVTRTLEAL